MDSLGLVFLSWRCGSALLNSADQRLASAVNDREDNMLTGSHVWILSLSRLNLEVERVSSVLRDIYQDKIGRFINTGDAKDVLMGC